MELIMNWTLKANQKYWNKAYQKYMKESTLSAKQVSDFIKVNPFVALTIENKAIQIMELEK